MVGPCSACALGACPSGMPAPSGGNMLQATRARLLLRVHLSSHASLFIILYARAVEWRIHVHCLSGGVACALCCMGPNVSLAPPSRRPSKAVRVCDSCSCGSYEGRCIVCGEAGTAEAFYCRECTVLEKDRDGCPKTINLGSAKKDSFYQRKKYAFNRR
uniref:PHF5-like protein n=1 Tax=Hemiselmis andersenii TaxID=464988 RepID=A0A6U4SPQ9_HEMAN|mmetsp:Transcript_29528/g.68994  ORF Transcript_29528/g.68994 Transcript_29528/m.68994 type:complete len:159 (-) Transcript_29528:379-855(-)